MPPRRRGSRASQKESDERLSVAETIAGLANSIEQPRHGVITRQNSYDDRSAANFARLPSMVVDEVDCSGSLPLSLHNVPLVTRSVSVDGSASTTSHGHVDIPTRKTRSPADRMPVHVQSQPSVCSANDSVLQSQSTLQSTSDVSETATCMETDTASCSVFSAVLMGWNPPVLASCPSSTVESGSPGEVSTLSTVEPDNHNASVGVVKLPLVLEPISDGTWLLVPMSASAACGSTVLPDTECVPVIQTVTQHNGQSADSLNNSVTQADVAHSSELVTAADSATLQLHSLGSLSILGNYYNVSGGCSAGSSSTVTGIVNGVSCSGHATGESASHSTSAASSSDEAVGQFGSLGALRDYYSRISASVAQSSSLTATKVQVFNSAASVASVENNEINNADALRSQIPAVSVPVCNDHIVQPVLCTVDMSAARNFDTQTKLNLQSASSEAANNSLPVRNSSRVLPAVSLDHHQASYDTSSNQLVTESQCSLGGSKPTPALLIDGGREQNSVKYLSTSDLLRHLPPKKRQKVSSDIQGETEQNGCQHRTTSEIECEQTADDDQRNVNVDPPDISLSEEIVTHIENPLSTSVAGIPNVSSL